MIKVDKRIKPPTWVARGSGRPATTPWKELEVGHSFFLPDPKASFRTTYWSRATGFKYVTERRSEHGIAGVRIWRIANGEEA